METINQLTTEILAITGTIRENYPELAQFLKEMPTSYSANPSHEVTLDQLKEYKNSLNELLWNYKDQQTTSTTKNSDSEQKM